MSLNYEFTEQLCRKMQILEKYPDGPGEKALIESLQKAKTKDIAARFIDTWIENNRRAPMPCDVHKAFNRGAGLERATVEYYPRLPNGVEPPPPEYRCNLCQDTGWFIVKSGRRSFDGVEYEAAKKCIHPLSQRGTRM